MTNAPETRKTHVIRIVGTNKNGDVLQDMWVDVERIDIAKNAVQLLDNDRQGAQLKTRWMDDPNADDYNPDGNPTRKTTIVKVCDSQSEDDVDDPSEWVPIRVISGMKSRGNNGSEVTGLGIQHGFRTTSSDGDPSVTTRKFEVRKIIHYDTSIDDAAQAAFDDDPTLAVYVVQGADYSRIDSTEDDSQFVDHEVMTYFKQRTVETSATEGGVDRGQQTKLLNQYLIDESDDPDGKVVGSNGINPPYRLDPYQNIINVNLGNLAVAFGYQALDAE